MYVLISETLYFIGKKKYIEIEAKYGGNLKDRDSANFNDFLSEIIENARVVRNDVIAFQYA